MTNDHDFEGNEMNEKLTDLAVFERDLQAQLAAGAPVRLDDTPDFPLAFDVALPSDIGEPNGHVGIRFHDFEIAGTDAVRVDGERSDGDRVKVGVRWDDLQVDGRYGLTAKPAPKITLDLGGTMLDFDDDPLPGGANGDDGGGLTPDQYDAMIAQAREQRTRLMDQPHGQVLVRSFNEHNEIFNDVFVKSSIARTAWTRDGATREMALHTHDALQPENEGTTHVNPHDQTFGEGSAPPTYNGNSFSQWLQITVNTIATDPNFNPFDPNARLDPDSPYTKASLDALNFSNAVNETGNTKEQINPMTGTGVFGAVEEMDPPPPSTVDQLQNIVDQAQQDGGAAAELAEDQDWLVLDEEDRRDVRRYLYLTAKERAEAADVAVQTLWEGACQAEVGQVEAELSFETIDGRLRLVATSLELPAFEFELDDSEWSGEAADMARERLAEVSFVRSLLRERIQTGLTDALTAAALTVLDIE